MGRVDSGQILAAIEFVGAYILLSALLMANNLILFNESTRASGQLIRWARGMIQVLVDERETV